MLGLIAKAIIPGKQHSPLWLTTIFGILGAIVGNAIARGPASRRPRGIDWGRHALQLVAAIVIVVPGRHAYMATMRQASKTAGPAAAGSGTT